MPLDTTPLSPLRRAIALLAVCAILAAALGLAQAIIHSKSAGASPSRSRVTLEPLFPVDATLKESGPVENVWAITVAGRMREFRTYVRPTDEPPTIDVVKELGLDLLRARGVGRSYPQPGTVAGLPAVSRLGLNAKMQPVAVLAITIVEGHCVALYLSGDSGDNDLISRVDLDVFERICAKTRLLVNGRPYPASPRRPL